VNHRQCLARSLRVAAPMPMPMRVPLPLALTPSNTPAASAWGESQHMMPLGSAPGLAVRSARLPEPPAWRLTRADWPSRCSPCTCARALCRRARSARRRPTTTSSIRGLVWPSCARLLAVCGPAAWPRAACRCRSDCCNGRRGAAVVPGGARCGFVTLTQALRNGHVIWPCRGPGFTRGMRPASHSPTPPFLLPASWSSGCANVASPALLDTAVLCGPASPSGARPPSRFPHGYHIAPPAASSLPGPFARASLARNEPRSTLCETLRLAARRHMAPRFFRRRPNQPPQRW
jgi:hypothetical protein